MDFASEYTNSPGGYALNTTRVGDPISGLIQNLLEKRLQGPSARQNAVSGAALSAAAQSRQQAAADAAKREAEVQRMNAERAAAADRRRAEQARRDNATLAGNQALWMTGNGGMDSANAPGLNTYGAELARQRFRNNMLGNSIQNGTLDTEGGSKADALKRMTEDADWDAYRKRSQAALGITPSGNYDTGGVLGMRGNPVTGNGGYGG